MFNEDQSQQQQPMMLQSAKKAGLILLPVVSAQRKAFL
jgi:hypothetical protein